MTARPTLKQLEAFVEIASTRHFAKSAARLGTTQPNISSRLAALEALVGGVLVNRKAQPLALTPLGQDLLPTAQATLDQAAKFAEASGAPRLLPSVVRLGMSELAAQVLLPEFVEVLTQMYPGMGLETQMGLSADIERDLDAGNLDLALCNAPFRLDALRAIHLADFSWTFVAAPIIAAADVQTIITGARKTQAYQHMAWTLSQFPPSAAVRLVPHSSLAVARDMILMGQGHGLLPGAMVAAHLGSGNLVECPMPSFMDGMPTALQFSVLYNPARPGNWLANLAEAFSKFQTNQSAR